MILRELRNILRDIISESEVEYARSNARGEADSIIETVLQCNRSFIIVHGDDEVDPDLENVMKSYAERRQNGEPIQYILGKADFMGLEFTVTPDVLIPRPDTETLASDAIEEIKKRAIAIKTSGDLTKEINFLDLCTGSGAICVAVANYIETLRGVTIPADVKINYYASDLSLEALNIAKKNGDRYNLPITYIQSDLLKHFTVDAKFDVIASNPPYIAPNEMYDLPLDVRAHEPIMALLGLGEDGTGMYEEIAKQAKAHIKEGATLIFEIGCTQVHKVCNILQLNDYTEIGIIKDIEKRDRVVKGLFNG